jgi:hypothetical protein
MQSLSVTKNEKKDRLLINMNKITLLLIDQIDTLFFNVDREYISNLPSICTLSLLIDNENRYYVFSIFPSISVTDTLSTI